MTDPTQKPTMVHESTPRQRPGAREDYDRRQQMVAATPAEAFPPADFIQEEMKARGWTVKDLAVQMAWDFVGARNIAQGRWRITRLSAAAVARAFGTSAEFWLNLQATYDRWLAAQELQRITPPNAELLKLADRNPPPQEWFDEEGEDLFV